MNTTNNQKQIFQVGDRVYDVTYGWGEVMDNIKVNCIPYTISVDFDKNVAKNVLYTFDGRLLKGERKTLSFTKYTLDGFSQERPVNYNDYIGKWGMFSDEAAMSKSRHLIMKLECFREDKPYPFNAIGGGGFRKFKPLTDKQIKILELE